MWRIFFRRRSFGIWTISLACSIIGAAPEGRAAELSSKEKARAPRSAPPPAPLGVFGADMPAAGRLVVSIAPGFYNLSGIRIGARTVSNEYVVTRVPFFLNPRQMVRIVPQNIAAATQVVGLNYGVSDNLSVILNAGVAERRLETLVFKGSAGITPLVRNYPGTASLTDFTLSGVYRVYQDDINRIQFSLGFSFPTGSNRATFNNFTLPDGSVRNIRGFYGMQIGAGTFDIMPGVLYAGNLGPWSWGLSYRGRFPLAPNPEGYLWGDLHEVNSWAGYSWTPALTTTVRVNASMQGPIRGFDPEIRGAAAPANPLFYGGQRVELFGGATLNGKVIGFENATLAAEAGAPVYQNLNGPQIMKNWQATMCLRVKM